MNIVTFGGGVNSAALVLWMMKNYLSVDLILFADTGCEKPDTYKYLDIFDDYLSQFDQKIIRLRYEGSLHNYSNLEQECLHHRTLPSLAYGHKSCSQKWKIGVIDKYLKNHSQCQEEWKNKCRVNRYIGIDAGETHRFRRMTPGDRWYSHRFPLVDNGIDRIGCLRLIVDAGLPIPPKSACFFCPASTKAEVAFLRDTYPELYQRAIAMEENMIITGSVIGLGRDWAWRDLDRAAPVENPFYSCGCGEDGVMFRQFE